MNPNCLLFHKERERERESPKSSREGVVGWCDGAWKIFEQIWIIVRQGSIALAVGAGGGCLDIFFSRLSFLFSFSLFGRRPDID